MPRAGAEFRKALRSILGGSPQSPPRIIIALQVSLQISADEAMQKLRITGKTTLQKLRDEGKIAFSQPQRKIILYDSESIEEYLIKKLRKTF